MPGITDAVGPLMTESILGFAEALMASPWIYLIIFAIACLDAFFPVVPSETLVITSAVFAASGPPGLAGVIAAAALGAFVGDHISYTIGRYVGRPIIDRAAPGSKRRTAFDWAMRELEIRGGLVLVVARYIPGGRTATTLSMGALHYPLRKFSFFDAIAALSWACYSALIGYLGGAAFEHNPLHGLLLGLGIAFTITAIVEATRHVRTKRARARAAGPEPGRDHNVGHSGDHSGDHSDDAGAEPNSPRAGERSG